MCGSFCRSAGIRTLDPLIKSQLLCQLSYRPWCVKIQYYYWHRKYFVELFAYSFRITGLLSSLSLFSRSSTDTRISYFFFLLLNLTNLCVVPSY